MAVIHSNMLWRVSINTKMSSRKLLTMVTIISGFYEFNFEKKLKKERWFFFSDKDGKMTDKFLCFAHIAKIEFKQGYDKINIC